MYDVGSLTLTQGREARANMRSTDQSWWKGGMLHLDCMVIIPKGADLSGLSHTGSLLLAAEAGAVDVHSTDDSNDA